MAPLTASLVQPVISSVVKGISGRGVRRSRGRICGWKFLVPLFSLNNIEITNYLRYEPKFNDIFSRNNLPIIKDGTYVINLDYKNNKGTHWVSLFTDTNLSVYFDSFGTEYIPQEVSNKIKDKPITPNIIRIQDNESIIYYVCILLYRFYRMYICLQEKLCLIILIYFLRMTIERMTK